MVNFVSLDGVIQSPLAPDEDRDGGFAHGGWVPPHSDDTVNAFMQEATVSAAGMLLGCRSYEILATAWSGADESEPAVAAMNRMPKHVVSSKLREPSWQNTSVITGDLTSAVTGLKARTEGDLVVFGSGTLVRGLAEHDLVTNTGCCCFHSFSAQASGCSMRTVNCRGSAWPTASPPPAAWSCSRTTVIAERVCARNVGVDGGTDCPARSHVAVPRIETGVSRAQALGRVACSSSSSTWT